MTKFNPENKEKLTYGEAIAPMMRITDLADAIQYKNAYLNYIKEGLADAPPESRNSTPEEIFESNLTYFLYSKNLETRERVIDLFLTTHANDQKPTPQTPEFTNEDLKTIIISALETIVSCNDTIKLLLEYNEAHKTATAPFLANVDKYIKYLKCITETWHKNA